MARGCGEPASLPPPLPALALPAGGPAPRLDGGVQPRPPAAQLRVMATPQQPRGTAAAAASSDRRRPIRASAGGTPSALFPPRGPFRGLITCSARSPFLEVVRDTPSPRDRSAGPGPAPPTPRRPAPAPNRSDRRGPDLVPLRRRHSAGPPSRGSGRSPGAPVYEWLISAGGGGHAHPTLGAPLLGVGVCVGNAARVRRPRPRRNDGRYRGHPRGGRPGVGPSGGRGRACGQALLQPHLAHPDGLRERRAGLGKDRGRGPLARSYSRAYEGGGAHPVRRGQGQVPGGRHPLSHGGPAVLREQQGSPRRGEGRVPHGAQHSGDAAPALQPGQDLHSVRQDYPDCAQPLPTDPGPLRRECDGSVQDAQQDDGPGHRAPCVRHRRVHVHHHDHQGSSAVHSHYGRERRRKDGDCEARHGVPGPPGDEAGRQGDACDREASAGHQPHPGGHRQREDAPQRQLQSLRQVR
eukprot:scaffold179_cov368-Prasinococcus_capsulatus_cf.AAC.40